jgi:hypothetical protein
MNPTEKIPLSIMVFIMVACSDLTHTGNPGYPAAYDLALQASRARILQKYNARFDTLNIQHGLLLFEVFDFLLKDNDIITVKLNNAPLFTGKRIGGDSYFEYLSIPNLVNNVLEIVADGTGDIIPATVGVRFPYYSSDTFRLKIERGKSHYFIINCLHPIPKFRQLNERILYVTDSVEIQHSDFSFSLRDYGLVDQDLVACYLNDTLVIPYIELTGSFKTFTLTLKPGSYTLGIHALTLGSVPPNTTCLSIDGISNSYGLISDESISACLKICVHTDSLTSKSHNNATEKNSD